MDTKEKLKEIVDSLLTEQDDRDLWDVLIIALEEKEAGAILAMIEEEPDRLAVLNDNLQAKLDALLSCDQDDWAGIVNQEIESVKNS